MQHYHIRWADGELDWEAFKTEEEAEVAATELVRTGETYIIEQLDGECSRCAGLHSETLARWSS